MESRKIKQPTKEEANKTLNKGFDDWEKSFESLAEAAENSFMPLLAESVKLSKSILQVYRKAFTKTMM